jgi:hypothetical protein
MEINEKLIRSTEPLVVDVHIDEYTNMCSKAFDFEFSGTTSFYPWELPKSLPSEFGLGVIIGGSGSGKSTMLKEFGEEPELIWSDYKSIASHFDTPDQALNR